MGAVDGDERREHLDSRGELGGCRQRGDLLHAPLEHEVGVGVEADGGRLACPHRPGIHLVDAHPHLHARRIDHVDHGRAGVDFVAFLDAGHLVAAVGRAQHREAVERGAADHHVGVGLRVAPGAFGAVAADLEDPDVCGGRADLERERLPQLREAGRRLLQREVVLLGVDPGQELVLLDLQPRPPDVVVGHRQRRLVRGQRRLLVGFLLEDLLFEIEVFGAAVHGRAHLVLPIELDQDIARAHARSAGHEARDGEVVRLAGEPRRHRGGRPHRFSRARGANLADERAALDGGGAGLVAGGTGW